MTDFDWKPLLAERAQRLAKLIEMRAPAIIIAAEVVMVHRAAFCAYPAEMGRTVARAELEHQQMTAGFCVGCGEVYVGLPPLCALCVADVVDVVDDEGTT